jgi:excinuclease ABC subunit C
MNREGLARLRARRDTAPSEGAAKDSAAPGQAYQDWTVQVAAPEPNQDPDAYTVKPERVFVPGVKDFIVLRPGSSERYLMERVRDEAHRFAIGHHRKRRGKRSLRSALDDIEGVGPQLKRALVQHFGSVAAIRSAEPEALCEVKGIGAALAARIHAVLGRH